MGKIEYDVVKAYGIEILCD